MFQLCSLGSMSLSPPSAERDANSVRFVCISDTHQSHQHLPALPPGDVLVHCGDFTNFGSLAEVQAFVTWFAQQPFATKLVVPGNHDMLMDRAYYGEYWKDWSPKFESHEEALKAFEEKGIKVLIDESTQVSGLHIYGSPWVTKYAPWSTAFNKVDSEIEKHWQTLPSSIDVLLTHMPPWGIGDRSSSGSHKGCRHLAKATKERCPRLHVFGHVHTDHGIFQPADSSTTYVNATSVSNSYRVGGRAAVVVDVAKKGS